MKPDIDEENGFKFTSHGDEHWIDIPQLTKREWFAGMAIMGILAGRPEGIQSFDCPWKDWAKSAVKQADAILAELTVKP